MVKKNLSSKMVDTVQQKLVEPCCVCYHVNHLLGTKHINSPHTVTKTVLSKQHTVTVDITYTTMHTVLTVKINVMYTVIVDLTKTVTVDIIHSES